MASFSSSHDDTDDSDPDDRIECNNKSEENSPETVSNNLATCMLNLTNTATVAKTIYVDNSKDVQVGHRIYYNAPVTINVNAPSQQITNEIASSSDKCTFARISDQFSNSDLKLVDREDWLAEPPTEDIPDLQHPVPYVIFSHTCTSPDASVRSIQSFHIDSQDWPDIAYNFLVGESGHVYVGLGWDKVGTHTFRFNSRSIGIAFIGKYSKCLPPETHLKAARQLIELGVKIGKISSEYKLLGQCQVTPMDSPGKVLYNELKAWPHWSSVP